MVLKHVSKAQNTVIRTYMRGLPSSVSHHFIYGHKEIFYHHLITPVNIIPVHRNLSTGVIRHSSGISGDNDERDSGEGSTGRTEYISHSTRSTLYYIAALGVLAFGLSYAAVPLYRIFCQVWWLAGGCVTKKTQYSVYGLCY